MELTPQKQAEIIERACKENDLDGHIKWLREKSDAQTHAEKMALRLCGEEAAEKPVKSSYMYCDSLDMCFFFTPWGLPSMTYSGYAGINDTDVTAHSLEQSFRAAGRVLDSMRRILAEEVEKGSI